MSVFVKTLSDLVALLLEALRLSVLLPASVLVGLNVAFVLPLFKDTRIYHALRLDGVDFPLTIIILTAVLIIAYTLAILNIPIIRFFEGYPWLTYPWGKRLRLSHARRVAYLQSQIEKLDRDIQMWLTRADQEPDRTEAEKCKEKARRCELQRNLFKDELWSTYPHHQTWRILPTRLGNVIAAAEEYSGTLYELDAVVFWPFLLPILSDEGYAPFMEREKAAFDFLLNMAVVTLFFGAELIYVDVLLSEFNIWAAGFKLLLIGVVAFCFYLTSIQGALSWGCTIRTAFVLHRHQLREKLGLCKPDGFYEERNMWRQASRFYRDHDVTPGRYIFDYSPPDKAKASKTKS